MEPLRPYQEEDAAILAGRRYAILAHDPGLGKTRTALYAAKLAGFRRIAVIAPAVVRDHWKREKDVIYPEADLHVDSYQRLVVNAAARMAFGRRDVLILDEEHFLKSRTSQRSKIVLGKAGLAHAFPRVWGASGTPMPRHPAELWPWLFAFHPNALVARDIRTYDEFLNRFTWYRRTEWGPKVYAARNVPELKLLLSDVLIRRTVREANLPPLRMGVVTVTAPDLRDVLALQQDVDPSVLAMLDRGELPQGDGSRFAMAKLRHAIGDLKVHAAVDLLRDELDSDPHATRVVFAFHHSVLNVLEKELASFGVVGFRGGMTPAQQREAVESFGTATRRVFAAQITAAAVGLDGLQHKAHEAVILEPEWNSDYNVQAGRRLARLGQTQPVQVRMLALAGTVDEALVRGHFREARMRREVVDAEE